MANKTNQYFETIFLTLKRKKQKKFDLICLIKEGLFPSKLAWQIKQNSIEKTPQSINILYKNNALRRSLNEQQKKKRKKFLKKNSFPENLYGKYNL